MYQSTEEKTATASETKRNVLRHWPKDVSSPVIPARFERATHSLEGCCSIQLSYGTVRPYRMQYVLRHKSNINTPTFQTHPAENRGGGVR